MRVMIIPGHGDGDNGAVSPCGKLVESQYVLAVGNCAHDMVVDAALDDEVMVRLSRHSEHDQPHSVSDRVRYAKEWSADLVIELHVDAATTPSARGTCAYYWPGNTLTKDLADYVVRSTMPELYRRGSSGRPVSDGYPRAKGLLAAYPMPALLIEFGFVTNPQDVAALLAPMGVYRCANLVAGCVFMAAGAS